MKHLLAIVCLAATLSGCVDKIVSKELLSSQTTTRMISCWYYAPGACLQQTRHDGNCTYHGMKKVRAETTLTQVVYESGSTQIHETVVVLDHLTVCGKKKINHGH